MDWVLIVGQVFLVITIALTSEGRRQPVIPILAWFNPGSWLCFVVALWFIYPQILYKAYEEFGMGEESIFATHRADALRSGQLAVIGFLTAVQIGFLVYYAVRPGRAMTDGPADKTLQLFRKRWILWAFYALGLLCVMILAARFDGGPRSNLVQSISGRALYAFTMFGSAASTYFAGHSIRKRRYLQAVVFCLPIYFGLFLLGGRGRILWPIVNIFVFLVAVKSIKPGIGNLSVLSLPIILGIAFLKPILRALQGDPSSLDPSGTLMSLFELGENTDAFGNLAVIVRYNEVRQDPALLLGGSMDAFMSTYYPEIYSRGVELPATFIGELWLGGGPWGIALGGALYGIVLQIIAAKMRHARLEMSLWLYVVGLPLLCAINTGLSRSAGKYLSCILPVAICWIIQRWCWRPAAVETSSAVRVESLDIAVRGRPQGTTRLWRV